MAAPQVDLDAMISAARERVERGWRPGGQNLNVLIAGDIRPLTSGARDQYLAFCAWFYGRALAEQERREISHRLTNVPIEADWAFRDDVLATCALWETIQRCAPEEQQAIRELLRQRNEPRAGASERSAPQAATPESSLAEAMRKSAADHAIAMGLLGRPNYPF